MDSLTQIVLGASISAIAGIRPFGRKVLIVGALLGTLPDLDVFISYSSAIDNFTYHRGFSHSLFVLTAFSLFLYYLFLYLKPALSLHKLSLFLVIFLPLITHPLLDSFTSYGTQLLWPLNVVPTSWSSVFVIDPLFTLPLLIAVIGLWIKHTSLKWQKINRIMLVLSGLYLAFGQLQYRYIKQHVIQDPITKNSKVFITPTPLNTMVWRVISYHDDIYYETFTTVLDTQPLTWTALKTGHSLLKGFDSEELQRLTWFSDGLLAFSVENDKLVATDLRIGLPHYYPFSFSVAKQQNQWQAITSEKRPQPPIKWEYFFALFK